MTRTIEPFQTSRSKSFSKFRHSKQKHSQSLIKKKVHLDRARVR